MSAAEEREKQGRTSKFRFYLTLAILCCLLFGFTWSLDVSFRYLGFGLSVYFFFLAFYNKPRSLFAAASGPLDHLTADLKIIFSPRKNTYTQQKGIPGRQKPTVIFVAFFFIFFVFVTIIVSVLLLSDDKASRDYLLDSANFYNTQEQYDSARVYYRKVLDAEPSNRDARFGMGDIFLAESNFDSALYYYDGILVENPSDEAARYNRALALFNQKNYSGSLKETAEVLRLNPRYQDALLLAGDNYYVQQRYDSAIFWYEQAYDLGVRTAILSHIMAYIYDVEGNTDRAIPLYQEAVLYDSTKTDVYKRLGELIPEESERYRVLENRFSEQQ
jgi:Flp pilus assembly protein TadD